MSKPIEQIKADVERRLAQLEQVQKERQERKAMLKEALLSDPTYVALELSAREVNKSLSLQKQALLNEPEYRALTKEEKKDAEEMKELRAMLTGDLFGYTKETDKFQIEAGGQLHNIQYKAKLVATDQPTML